MRGQWGQSPAQVCYLGIAKDAANGEIRVVNTDECPPGGRPDPTLEELRTFHAGIDNKGVTVDIEAAGCHLLDIGFCRLSDLESVCVRFRHKGGALWHTSYDTLRAYVEWVNSVLADPDIPLAFQYGCSYDILVLRDIGFEVNGYTFDTHTAARYTYPEMPANLEFLGILYGRLPGWKHLTRDDEAEDK